MYASRSSFVAKDILLFSKRLDVVEYHFKSKPGALPFEFLKQFIFLLFNIRKFKYINSQLVGYYSLLPALFGKLFGIKTIMLAGGADCFSFPSINYGNMRKPLLKWATKKSYQWSNLIMPVHESLVYQDYSYDKADYPAQGIKYFLPDVATKVQTVYNGYDLAKWKPLGLERKNNSFITVAMGLETQANYLRKGVDLIEKVALLMPHCTFTIIGAPKNATIGKGSSNIVAIDKVPNHELPQFLNQHEFYLQLSIAEGFPNALAEAMACGCIPVGSSVSGIPYIIGNTGFILHKRDVEALKQLLTQALTANKALLSEQAYRRIADNFTEQNREEGLFSALANA